MKKEPKVFIEDILESIERIETYLSGVKKKDFVKNLSLQDAVIRRLEIIGEATKNIPEEFRKKHHHIPWKQIAGNRDVLIHDYTGVNVDRVWNTAKKDLPILKTQIEDLL